MLFIVGKVSKYDPLRDNAMCAAHRRCDMRSEHLNPSVEAITSTTVHRDRNRQHMSFVMMPGQLIILLLILNFFNSKSSSATTSDPDSVTPTAISSKSLCNDTVWMQSSQRFQSPKAIHVGVNDTGIARETKFKQISGSADISTVDQTHAPYDAPIFNQSLG